MHLALAALESVLAVTLLRSTLSLFTPTPSKPGDTGTPFALQVSGAGPEPPFGAHSALLFATALAVVTLAAVVVALASGRRRLRQVAAAVAAFGWVAVLVGLAAMRDWQIDGVTWYRADAGLFTVVLVAAAVVSAAGLAAALAVAFGGWRGAPVPSSPPSLHAH